MCLLRILSCHGIADPNIYSMYLTNNSKFYRFLFVCVFVYFAVYVAETATPKMRGLLGACVQLMVFFCFSTTIKLSILDVTATDDYDFSYHHFRSYSV